MNNKGGIGPDGGAWNSKEKSEPRRRRLLNIALVPAGWTWKGILKHFDYNWLFTRMPSVSWNSQRASRWSPIAATSSSAHVCVSAVGWSLCHTYWPDRDNRRFKRSDTENNIYCFRIKYLKKAICKFYLKSSWSFVNCPQWLVSASRKRTDIRHLINRYSIYLFKNRWIACSTLKLPVCIRVLFDFRSLNYWYLFRKKSRGDVLSTF